MRQKLSDDEVMGICIGSLMAIGLAGVLGAVRTEIDQANAALALALVVIGAAWLGGRWAGGATAIVAATSFAFFLTAPYRSLTIDSTDDVLTTVLLLGVGLAVGTIAKSRHEAKAAGRAGTEEVAGSYRVARLAAEGADTDEVIQAVEAEVAAVLHLRECRFRGLPPDPALPELTQDGRIDAPYVFDGDGFALPAEGMSIHLGSGERSLGWLTCVPAEPHSGVSRDRRRSALVMADHLALVIESREGGPAGASGSGSGPSRPTPSRGTKRAIVS